MNRRDFLKLSSLGTAAVAVNGMPVKAFADNAQKMGKLRGSTDRVFVFVVLDGGNDGLNTIIPLDKYSELSNARSNVLIPQSQVLTLSGNATTGMHPKMVGMQQMYNAGQINIVQGVAYNDPNYSHFRSGDIWSTAADSNQFLDTGWIGRYLYQRFPGAPNAYPSADFLDPLAIELGSNISSSLAGPEGNIGFALSDIDNFYQIVIGSVDPAPTTPAGHELTFVRYITQQTKSYITSVSNAATIGASTPTAAYPAQNRLADQLKIVAQLIAGGLQTPIYIVHIGGFDTHSDQVDATNTTIGSHANLMQKLSEAIKAFYDDLKLKGKDKLVAGCTVSEFGRRIKSNASIGTDHGVAAPLISFGTDVIPGMIGSSPNLPTNATVDDQVPMQYDFRQIYASILQDWFMLTAAECQDILNGQTYNTLPIFKKQVNLSNNDLFANVNEFKVLGNYPNPVKEYTSIRFSSAGGHVQVMLFDEMGKSLGVIYENVVPSGNFEFNFNKGNLPPGNYYYQISNGSKNVTGKMLVIN